MRAIKIDSENRTVTEIDIDGDLKGMQQVVGGLLAHAFYIGNDGSNSCYVNDEGLLQNPQSFFINEHYLIPLAGNGLICGMDDDGDVIDCTIPLIDIINTTGFHALDEVQEMIRNGAVDYNTYFTTANGTEILSCVDLGAFDIKDGK